jgi:glucosamine-6-phosphate deaminase
MGGIGPDGHIAFNMAGSDHRSVTRLSPTNYETQAAASADLGGIEVARQRQVVTIGLSTITHNPRCRAIVLAAGEAKAGLVRDGVEEETGISYPVTALRKLAGARLYITAGAAKLLEERRLIAMERSGRVSDELVDRVVVDLAVKRNRAVRALGEADLKGDRFGAFVLSRSGMKAGDILTGVERRLVERINAGSTARSNTVFLHTAPHHDDIILGYLPYTVRHIRDASNSHSFAYMTSGFNAVTNGYALSQVRNLSAVLQRGSLDSLIRENYFNPANTAGRRRDVWQYLDGVASGSSDIKEEGEARRMLRNLMEIFEDEDIENLKHRIDELMNYFHTQYPGKKDLPYIQKLKGMIREWESDCKWGYLGFDCRSIHHLRLGFYQGELFTEEPLLERDVRPVLNLFKNIKPNVVTVAFDPEASGPDTHYKVLQAVAEALRLYQEESGRSDIEVIGYRNVWFRFHPAESNIYVPVSLNMFAVLQNTFENAFGSQREASFPSHEFEGTFAGLAQQVQVQQYRTLKTCLGREYFYEHPSPLLRATRGFVYLKKMTPEGFYSHARKLRSTTEDM